MDFIDHFDYKHKPKVLLFENVKNIETHDNGNTKIIQRSYKKSYFGRFIHLNTSLITNIPQNREKYLWFILKMEMIYLLSVLVIQNFIHYMK